MLKLGNQNTQLVIFTVFSLKCSEKLNIKPILL